MKIIALADTHIKSGNIEKMLQVELIELMKKADIVIHAGDFVTKHAYDEISGICRLEAVHGNMDEFGLKTILPERKIIEAGSLKIGIIHKAALSVNDTTGARYMAKEIGVDVLVFGHIHKPVIEKSDVLLICPGSPTSPRLSEPGVIELDIESGEVTGRFIPLPGRRCGAFESMRDF